MKISLSVDRPDARVTRRTTNQARLSLALLGGFLLVGCKPPTEQIISECIVGPRPSSLEILQAGEKLGLDVHQDYIHFRISRRDLDAILAAEPYKAINALLPDYTSLNLEAWWTPQALGPDLKTYEYEVADPPGQDESWRHKTLYHNAQGNEVYLIMTRS